MIKSSLALLLVAATLWSPVPAAAATSAYLPEGVLETIQIVPTKIAVTNGPVNRILIRGWAFDTDAPSSGPSGAGLVRMVVDGHVSSTLSFVSEPRPDVAAAHPQGARFADVGFYAVLPTATGTREICISALDVNSSGARTGKYALLGCRRIGPLGQWYVRGTDALERNFGYLGGLPIACEPSTDPSLIGQGVEQAVYEGTRFHTQHQYNSTGTATVRFGTFGDKPLCGAWDGGATPTFGLYRPSNSTFYLSDGTTNSRGSLWAKRTVRFGRVGDTPVTGDWNDDGTTDIGVWRASNRTFYLRTLASTHVTTVVFGRPGDVPIAGDWNGDGTTDIGVDRASHFYLRSITDTAVTSFQYGRAGDVPVPARWNGGASDVIGVVRNLPPAVTPDCCGFH